MPIQQLSTKQMNEPYLQNFNFQYINFTTNINSGCNTSNSLKRKVIVHFNTKGSNNLIIMQEIIGKRLDKAIK